MPKLLNKVNLPRYSSAPATPAEADLYYNTSDDKIYVYTGAAWTEVGSGSGSEVYYQASAPASPAEGDIWIDSDDEVVSVTSITDSTSTTSSTVAASATAVKTAYDLANAAIPKTLTTTTGDIIYASSANTPARLGIGTASQVLSVAAGVPAWTTLSAGGADVQEFTTSGTWTKPSGKSAVFVFALGAGGGGASGGRGASSLARPGGPGFGGGHSWRWFNASDLAGTVTVTIGAGGAGATALASGTNSVTGGNGSDGGNTTFGTEVIGLGAPGGRADDGADNAYRSPVGPVEWGRNVFYSGNGGTSDAASNEDNDANFFYSLAPGVGYPRSGVNPVRALTRSGSGGAGGFGQTSTPSGGAAGARGFGGNGTMVIGGNYATGSGTAGNGEAGSVSGSIYLGTGGGGGGGALNATPGNGGAGYRGGGGGGGGGVTVSSGSPAQPTGAGGAGGGGYMLVISV